MGSAGSWREDMRITRQGYRVLAVLIGIGAAACGGAVSNAVEQGHQADAGTDGRGAGLDATSGEPEDAPGVVDAGADATNGGDDADADATSGSADAGDAADAEDATDAADANVPISCAETATCAAPISLGTIWGGVSSGVNEGTNAHGDHSDWYQVKIEPYPPPAASSSEVSVVIYFQSPPGLEFDLDVYLTTTEDPPVTCSQPVSSSTGDAGALQTIGFQFPDTQTIVLGWVTIHVIAKPGSQCATGAVWGLQLTTAL
jgi:hypothetical protein